MYMHVVVTKDGITIYSLLKRNCIILYYTACITNDYISYIIKFDI